MPLEHVIYCTPLGQANWQEFVLRKIEETQKQAIAETVIVLPSPYLLDQARRLLRDVNFESWQPPVVRSMDQLAEQVAGSKVFGRKLISRVSQEILLDSLIREANREGSLKWSVSIAAEPGFVRALAGLFDDFKMAGAGPEEVAAGFESIEEKKGEHIQKYREIEALYRIYQRELQEKRVLDIGEVYLLALEALKDESAKLPFSRIILAEFSVLSPLRTELLKQLKRRVSIELIFQYEKKRPEVFSAVEGTYSDLVGMGFETHTITGSRKKSPCLEHICQNLYSHESEPHSSEGCLKIAYFSSSRKEMEVLADEVKRRLLEKSCRPDEVAVVARNRDYLENIAQYFAIRGLPIDANESIPLSETSVAQFLDRLMSAAREGGEKKSVTALLKSLYIKGRLMIDPDKVEESCLERVIRSWEDWSVVGGVEWEGIAQLHRWANRWHEAAEIGEKAQVLIDFLYWADIPLQLGCERKKNARLFSSGFFQAEIHALKKIREILCDLVESAADYHSNICGNSGQDFMLIFHLAMQGEMISVKDRDAGGVQVVTPETASGMLFDSVFIVGMSEGIFPRMQHESWLLSEEERSGFEEVGIFLASSGSRRKNEDLAFALGVGMARTRLYISGVKNEDLLSSSYVSDVLEMLPAEGVPVRHYSGKHDWPDDESEIFDGRSLGRLVVQKIWQEGTNELRWKHLYSSMKSNLGIFPQGWLEKARLEYLKPPEFKGQLRLDWTNEDKKHSASALEIYANCPFVYLTDEVLRLRRWEHAEAGMDGMIRGLIWHEVLAGFLGQYRGKRLDPADLAKFLKELTSLFDVAIARLVSSGKIVLDAWWEMEETIWQEGLKRWLELEIERQRHDHSVPAYFEWSFGRVPASSSDPRSVMETLVLSFEKQKAQLQGKIDRVDLLSDGSFRVIDYKTGRIPSSGLLKKGILLQVPIYMLAVDRLLGTPNTPESEGEYLSLTYSGRRMKIPGRNNREEIVKGVTISVLSYADRIRKGDFSPDPAGDCPSYCLNRDCCHFVKQEQASMEEDFDE